MLPHIKRRQAVQVKELPDLEETGGKEMSKKMTLNISVLEHLISTGQYFMPTDERVSHGGGNYGAKEAGVFGIGLHHTPNSGLPAMKLPIPEPTNAFMPQNAPTGPIPPGDRRTEKRNYRVEKLS